MSSVDPSAWKDQLQSHSSWLRTVIRARLGCIHDVDDVLQDVMLDAVKAENAYQTVRQPGPWLYRIAIRKVLLFQRASGRRRRLMNKYHELRISQDLQSSQRQPLEQLIGAEHCDMVEAAFTRLRGQDAEILMLKYYHQWNYQQISDHLGLEYAKVANRLRRARGNLRLQLINDGE